MVARKRGLELLPKALRTYKTEKFIRVDVPRVGVCFRVCQIFALFLVFVQMYFDDAWAYSESPGGLSNAWDEPGSMLSSTNVPGYASTQPYCSNASWSYTSEAYLFDTPKCEGLLPAELTVKTSQSVFYTTSILETKTQGWPCSLADNDNRSSACVAAGGSFYARTNSQCGCILQKAIYPLAIEQMNLAIEHSFDTTDMLGLRGSSAGGIVRSTLGMEEEAVTPDGGMFSLIKFPNNTTKRFEEGEVLRLPLSEWLRAAGADLGAENMNVRKDSNGNYPRQRTSGMNIKVNIIYSNADLETGRAVPGKTQVHASIELQQEKATWTSAGTDTIWTRFPGLSRDVPQEFELVERWRQGVLFSFHTSGMVYAFNFFFMLNVVISGLVLLKMANAITNFYAFNCLGAESVVLRNKRIELASKKSEFAEIGMKAAMAAALYPKFDRMCDGTIEAEDIARSFAYVEGVSWEVAYMIAKNILADADSEPSLDGEPKGLNYVEFMTCLEGDAINFEEYLKDTRNMYDEHMKKDEARDEKAAAKEGKKPTGGKKEPTAKEKMKAAKAAADAKAKARKEKLEKAEAKMRADADAKDMDYDDYLAEKEDQEDDAMRTKCKAAFEEQRAEIEANPDRKQKPAAEEEEEDEEEEEEEEEEAEAAAEPIVEDELELDEEQKEERLGKAGKLKIHLDSASGLPPADKNGLADPYVVFKLGKKTKKSKVCEKTLTPSWGEDLEFVTKVTLKKIISGGLSMDVKDKDGFMDADDAMGSVSVSLEPLEAAGKIIFVEAITAGGVLKFVVQWEEGEVVTEKKKKKKGKDDDGPRAEAKLEEEPETTQTL